MQIIDGKAVAAAIKEEIKAELPRSLIILMNLHISRLSWSVMILPVKHTLQVRKKIANRLA